MKKISPVSILSVLILPLFIFLSTAFSQTDNNSDNLSSVSLLLKSDQVFKLLYTATYMSIGFLLGLMIIERILSLRAKQPAKKCYHSEDASIILPIIIEGITVILVVLTVAILALTNSITSEGTVGIISAIVGYVLGKSKSKEGDRVEKYAENISNIPKIEDQPKLHKPEQ